MFNFFRNKTSPPVDYSVLGTDLHSHLLPGIDDGARDMEDSLELIKGMVKLGFDRLITTPHVNSDYYPNSPETIQNGLAEVKKAVAEAGIKVEVLAAAEYLMDEGFVRLLDEGKLLTLPGNYVLVETGFLQVPPNFFDLLFRMQTKGYRPILAHPERYGFWHGDMENYNKVISYGCRLQVNLLSLGGHYGKNVRDVAFQLIKSGIVDYLASDLHNKYMLQELEEMLEESRVQKELKDGNFLNEAI